MTDTIGERDAAIRIMLKARVRDMRQRLSYGR